LFAYWPVEGSGGVIPDVVGGYNFGGCVGSGARVYDAPPSVPTSTKSYNCAGWGWCISGGFSDVAPTDEITITTWVKVHADTGYQDFVTFNPIDVGASQGRIAIQMPWNGNIEWHFGTPYTSLTTPFDSGTVSVWTHYAFLASTSGDYMKIYKDGVEAASTSGVNAFVNEGTVGYYFCGRRNNNFYGNIDELKMFDRALTPEEVCLDAGKTWGGSSCT